MRESDWFDEPGPGDQPPGTARPRWLLPVLAGVPWMVVAVLLVTSARSGPDVAAGSVTTDPGVDAVTVSPSHGPDHPQAAADAAVDPATPTAPEGSGSPRPIESAPLAGGRAEGLLLQEYRGPWRVTAGDEVLASMGIVLARAHLSGIGPRLPVGDISPAPDTYAEHLVVEAVEHPGASTSVVTVLAVVLVERDGQDPGVELRRVAIPLERGPDGPRAAGPAWELPAHLPDTSETVLEPISDPSAFAAADTALAVAGLGHWTTTGLGTGQGWPVVATVSDGRTQQQVWLRPHVGGYAVVGVPLHLTTSAPEVRQ